MTTLSRCPREAVWPLLLRSFVQKRGKVRIHPLPHRLRWTLPHPSKGHGFGCQLRFPLGTRRQKESGCDDLRQYGRLQQSVSLDPLRYRFRTVIYRPIFDDGSFCSIMTHGRKLRVFRRQPISVRRFLPQNLTRAVQENF